MRKGQPYNRNSDVLSMEDEIVSASSNDTMNNMRGLTDIKTCVAFTEEEQHILDEYNPANELHPSCNRILPATELPSNRASISKCTGAKCIEANGSGSRRGCDKSHGQVNKSGRPKTNCSCISVLGSRGSIKEGLLQLQPPNKWNLHKY
jgi:hypothetical protein